MELSGTHALHDLKRRRSPLYAATRRWVLSMRQRTDCETGPLFWAWILQNLRRPEPYATFILEREVTPVAIGSVLPDDGGVGKRHGWKGIWFGGINVHREARGQGLGHAIVETLLAHARHAAAGTSIYLYTDNPIAAALYERHGFHSLGMYTIGRRKQAVMKRPAP